MAKTVKTKSRRRVGVGQSAKAAAQGRRVYPPIPLKAWFKLIGLTQREVAEEIGVDETSLSLVGSGAREYMRHHLEDVAAYLSRRSGRLITPTMLLHPPIKAPLEVAISRLSPDDHPTAIKLLEALIEK